VRPVLFALLGPLCVMQGSEALVERYQRFISINLRLVRHRLADLTLDGAILLAVNGRLIPLLARWFQVDLKQIPPVSLDLPALIRKYGGPGVLDCPLPPVCLMTMRLLPRPRPGLAQASPLLPALAQESQLALGITEEDAILFEQANGQLDASEADTVRGMPMAPVREYAMHCASPHPGVRARSRVDRPPACCSSTMWIVTPRG
jgi:hypothetical protein